MSLQRDVQAALPGKPGVARSSGEESSRVRIEWWRLGGSLYQGSYEVQELAKTTLREFFDEERPRKDPRKEVDESCRCQDPDC